MMGSAPSDMAFKHFNNTFNGNKWFKIFGTLGAGLVGVTLLSQFFIGYMKNLNKQRRLSSMMNVTNNLISQKLGAIKPLYFTNNSQTTSAPTTSLSGSNLISQYLNNVAMINAASINKTEAVNNDIQEKPYKNDLRTLFTTNSAKILAIIPRTFNAKDTNGNEFIDGNEAHGTFLNAIDRLDEVKAEGFNTLHVLPINPPGKDNAMGTAGSVYAPEDLLKFDPILIDKKDPRSPQEQFKAFVDACHKKV